MNSHRIRSLAAKVTSFAVLFPVALAQTTTRESVGNDGLPFYNGTPDGISAVSADGRYVVFEAPATSPSSSIVQIVRRDRQLGVTDWVSVAPNGSVGNDASTEPSCSPDARWIVFMSYATNLLASTTPSASCVYVRDLSTATNTLENPGLGGAAPNGETNAPRITPNGAYVVFHSTASNLVPSDTNGCTDVFVRDRQSGVLSRVSTGLGGQSDGHSFEASISDDGRFVAFTSTASNLVASDTNGTADAFVHDRVTGSNARVDTTSSGAELALGAESAVISGDGRYVAYSSRDGALIPGDVFGFYDVIVHDRVLGTYEWASPGVTGQFAHGDSRFVYALSPDGRFLVYTSVAPDLVSGDTNGLTDVFLRDRALAITERVNVTTTGAQVPPVATPSPSSPSVSPDGRFVSFGECGNLVIGKHLGTREVYLRDRQGVGTLLESYCTAKTNSASCTPMISASGLPSVSGATAFQVTASDVLRDKFGLGFWGLQATAIPFGGGTVCVQPPVVRLPPQFSGGSSTVGNCGGHYSYAFSPAYLASFGLVAGQTMHCQFWSRDTGFSPPNNIGLTDALRFTLGL